MNLSDRLETVFGKPPLRLAPLSGGCIADVRLAEFAGGFKAVAKLARDAGESTLDLEAFMLRYLAERSALPVPRVLHAEPDLLVLEHVENDGRVTESVERDAAEHLAALHAVRPDLPTSLRFGFERDTPIGPLPQANLWTDSWIEFFRDHRLLRMADEAARHGQLPAGTRRRIGGLAGRLGEIIDEPVGGPSLVHGDVWSGNVLAKDGRLAALIDPAISHSHPEMELAFITLFSTFGRAFFDRYLELRPIGDGAGFFATRRHVYNLYPLLVHARLFGGGYAAQVASSLDRLGF